MISVSLNNNPQSSSIFFPHWSSLGLITPGQPIKSTMNKMLCSGALEILSIHYFQMSFMIFLVIGSDSNFFCAWQRFCVISFSRWQWQSLSLWRRTLVLRSSSPHQPTFPLSSQTCWTSLPLSLYWAQDPIQWEPSRGLPVKGATRIGKQPISASWLQMIITNMWGVALSETTKIFQDIQDWNMPCFILMAKMVLFVSYASASSFVKFRSLISVIYNINVFHWHEVDNLTLLQQCYL